MSMVSKRSVKKVHLKEPAWFVELTALAGQITWAAIGSAPVVDFENACRRHKRFSNIKSWKLIMSGQTVYGVSWVAADPRWSCQ